MAGRFQEEFRHSAEARREAGRARIRRIQALEDFEASRRRKPVIPATLNEEPKLFDPA